tara:strand:+ start:2239 stop:3720 length:1482 start_codon:yes stop_codon:yes gene_type:complete
MVFIQHNTIFDFSVLGSGISGIYTTYLLSKQFPNSTILVIEKQNNPGGRVHTFKNKHMTVEAGAGRFYSGQTHIFDLIHELDLSNRIIPIHNTYGYAPSDNTDSIHTSLFDFQDNTRVMNHMKSFLEHNTTTLSQSIPNAFINYDTFIPIIKKGLDSFLGPNTLPCSELILQVIVKSSKFTHKYLRSINFIELSHHFLTPKQVEYIKHSFGYYAKLVYYNSFDAIHIFKQHINPFNNYFALKNGLSAIISHMLLFITKNKNVVFKYNHQVNDINYSRTSGIFKIVCTLDDSHTVLQSRKCICALPKYVLENIPLFQPIYKHLSSIQCSPLCRIYVKYPKNIVSLDNNQKQVWFHGIKGRITTNNDLRMIIPIDEDNGIIMISYSDSHFARKWKSIFDCKGKPGVHSHISKLVKRSLDIDIPMFTDMNLFFWDCGVAFWSIDTNSHLASHSISNHFKNIPLAICGEHYSHLNQQWIEGSLETAHNAFQHIRHFS